MPIAIPSARAMIQDAFEAIQIYSPGEAALDADVARGFNVLNDMLDSWSNEALTTYATILQSVTFTPGQYQYTIGVGAQLDTTRPIRILDGWGAAYILDQTGNRYPLEVITRDKWNQIGNILQVNANIPMYLWYDSQYPWGILNFFPIPNIGYQAFFNSYLQFVSFDSLDTPVNLPPGYVMAIKRNLSLELAPYYPAAVVSKRLQTAAERSKGNVKRSNVKEVVAQYDSELVSRAKATYNVYRDTGT